MVATLAILLSVGFGSRKAGLIDDAFSKKLSKLVVTIGQPMLIINSLISLEYSAENLRRGFTALGLSFGLHLFMGILAFGFARPLKDADKRKISEFALVFVNAGFIGFPILESLLGEDGLFCGAFYLIGFHLFLWTWGILVLSRGREDIKLTPRKIFMNYGTVPCLIGLVLYLIRLPIPEFIRLPVGYLAEICTPLTMMIAGSLIAKGGLRNLVSSKINYYVVGVRLFVIPAIACVVLKLVGLSEYYIIFGTVMAALPSASMATILGELYGIDPVYASRIVGFTTILCTVTLPLAVTFAGFIAAL